MENRSGGYLSTLLKGIVGSAIFIYIGYLVSGAIGMSGGEDISFIDALLNTIKSPFDNYFNDYSPITMILGFIIFEILYFLKMYKSRILRDVSDPDKYAPDILDVAASAGLDNPEVTKRSNEMFRNIFSNINGTNDAAILDSSLDFTEKAEDRYADSYSNSFDNDFSVEQAVGDVGYNSEEESDYTSFSADITTELLSDDYNLAQIKAMVPILKYLDIKSASALEKMFKVDMSANDIAEYIRLIYE